MGNSFLSLGKNRQLESPSGLADEKRKVTEKRPPAKPGQAVTSSARMERESLETKLTALLEPLVCFEGLLLVELQYRPEGGGLVLRLVVDRATDQAEQGGVSLDECVSVSRQVSDLLDVEDLIPCRYRLEVSSPGLRRKLKTSRDFEIFSGRLIKLMVRGDDNKIKTWKGYLKGLQGQDIILETEGVLKAFPLTQMVRANLEI